MMRNCAYIQGGPKRAQKWRNDRMVKKTRPIKARTKVLKKRSAKKKRSPAKRKSKKLETTASKKASTKKKSPVKKKRAKNSKRTTKAKKRSTQKEATGSARKARPRKSKIKPTRKKAIDAVYNSIFILGAYLKAHEVGESASLAEPGSIDGAGDYVLGEIIKVTEYYFQDHGPSWYRRRDSELRDFVADVQRGIREYHYSKIKDRPFDISQGWNPYKTIGRLTTASLEWAKSIALELLPENFDESLNRDQLDRTIRFVLVFYNMDGGILNKFIANNQIREQILVDSLNPFFEFLGNEGKLDAPEYAQKVTAKIFEFEGEQWSKNTIFKALKKTRKDTMKNPYNVAGWHLDLLDIFLGEIMDCDPKTIAGIHDLLQEDKNYLPYSWSIPRE